MNQSKTQFLQCILLMEKSKKLIEYVSIVMVFFAVSMYFWLGHLANMRNKNCNIY